MDSFYAVKPLGQLRIAKRDLLLFDRVLVPAGSSDIGRLPAAERANFEFLRTEGMVDAINPAVAGLRLLNAGRKDDSLPMMFAMFVAAATIRSMRDQQRRTGSHLLKIFARILTRFAPQAVAASVEQIDGIRTARLLDEMKDLDFSGWPAELTGVPETTLLSLKDAVLVPSVEASLEKLQPLLDEILNADQEPSPQKLLEVIQTEGRPSFEDVIQVVIEAFPVPDHKTPWEKIIDFRADELTRLHSLQLRQWMRKIASEQHERKEIREELAYLMATFRDHMALHRLKIGSGVLQSVVTIPAEIMDGILNRKWGDAAKALFKVHARKIALLEAERSAPGRDVAYIVKAQQQFGSNS
jgi:hypothetical protein